MTDALDVRLVGSIGEIPAEEWHALTDGLPPFVRRPWLLATEQDGPVAREPGWNPQHLLVRSGDRLIGAVPLYVRDRSDGEFIWHGTMEEALERSGLPSTPRAVSTLPATPVPSPRLLLPPDRRDAEGRATLRDVLAVLADRLGWASTHVQFCDEEETAGAAPQWIHRLSRQARWRRRGATTVEEWLRQYSSKRRTSIRREMKELDRQGLALEFVPAADAPDALFARAAELHRGTAERYGEAVRFGPRFFEALSAPGLREHVLFVVARPAGGGDPVGVATKVRWGDALFGRLWGAAERVRFLHFNVAMYGGIRFCLEHGLDRFEPGHGGFHKERRGFPTEPVHSLHRYRSPAAQRAFEDWARRERAWVRDRIDESRAESGLKS